jgi:hypothetical protein
MTNDGFDAMNLVASVRSKGVRFTDSGPEIPEHLTAWSGCLSNGR